jgi:queuine tRNA-ribosyltransferase
VTGDGGARCEVVTTRTGALAMRDRASGEIMHPGTGPREEPVELYVTPSRLAARLSGGEGAPLVLLDVGLGAASNAIAAWRASEALSPRAPRRRLTIVSFDDDLSALALALRPENRAGFDLTGAAYDAARALLETGRHDAPNTTWRLRLGDFPVTLACEPDASADLVYWDFYSAKTHPTLWTAATFRGLRRVCRDGATLHTYSTATSMRAALLLAGFAVGAGPATGLRRETTVAAVCVDDLERPLDARWLARLARSTAPLPSDAGEREAAMATIRFAPQFR